MDPRPHASIGEVLGELQVEFPDVTISKIRFLESQGLINPERTPSGYRKFYEADVARLRWILAQQQHNFLPLKVIKDRLAHMDAEGIDPADETVVVEEATPKPTKRKGSGSTTRRRKPKIDMPELPLDDAAPDDLATSPSGASFSRVELAAAAGLTDEQVRDLESFALITPVGAFGGDLRYDEDALVIARSAAGFFQRGIEARHLRMYRTFAQREVALFEQVVLPMLRSRNPEGRSTAHEEIGELARSGRALRAAYLRAAVAELLDE
jgi:DNA-binding transcriptional MerR regulator